MKTTLLLAGCFFILNACKKDAVAPEQATPALRASTATTPIAGLSGTEESTIIAPAPPLGVYTTYTIPAGQHFSDKNTARAVFLSRMNFVARFNNSAQYTVSNPVNQADVNMLYGFSEGSNHLLNSARIGWNWYNGALRLYAYVYKHGVRRIQEITSVAIGSDINCSIGFQGFTPATSYYVFTVNGVTVKLPRANFTSLTLGYQLYPYFGGDEVAPHTITVDIKNM